MMQWVANGQYMKTESRVFSRFLSKNLDNFVIFLYEVKQEHLVSKCVPKSYECYAVHRRVWEKINEKKM